LTFLFIQGSLEMQMH